ncbi:MAG: ATP synthase F1 subunit delta [Lewinellaceae bacterium]|nr:ATP synthase F1 subunit delta [Saprospiraceae bacterium]MCB9337620.1 ATP synthase F1 subunit delta [Lewinellaceae bacterium]
MSVQRIATRYAKSLIDLANEHGKLDKVLEDVKSFREVAKNRDFDLLLKSPVVKGDTKQKIFNKLFQGKFDEMTMAFLTILLKKGREAQLTEIANEFVDQFKVINHISTVKLTTANKLTPEAVENIHKKLLASTATDDKVELVTKVNPDLIGGFVVEFEDKLYDASVAHKLSLLKKEFKDNLYISQIIAQ